MTKAYYTLVSRNSAASRWCIEFGDYDRNTVKEEQQDLKDDGHSMSNLMIIKSGDTQSEIDAAVAALNR